MRWNEIVVEDMGVLDVAKNAILDVVASLKAQGAETITVQQVVDLLSANPDLEGTAASPELVNQALKGVQGINVTPDPETGQMSVFIDNPTAGRQVDQKQAEKDDKAVRSAALRSIDRKGDEL
jgi:hypothetical protein